MGRNYYPAYDKGKKPTAAASATETAESENIAPASQSPIPREETPTARIRTAHVTGCTCLNIRANPGADAKVLSVIMGGTEVSVNEGASTDAWCRVRLADGTTGYAMRKFLTSH